MADDFSSKLASSKLTVKMENPTDRPVFDPGEIIDSPNSDLSCRIIEHIGEGRCCMVYSAKMLRDGSRVALKVFKRGPTYDGAVQREQYILELFNQPCYNIVTLYGQFIFNGLHCQIMELLECNIRSVIFRNERHGLSPWATQKFAKDVLTALASLHEHSFAHADLKPANIMWSSYDGCFKILDFGLTFHTDEDDLHQVQSTGYKAPEAAEWNKYKDDMKRKRKRKLQGTYSDLTKAAPNFGNGLDSVGVCNKKVEFPAATVTSPVPSGASRTILKAPPRRHRLAGVPGGSSDCESLIVLEEYQRHSGSSRRGSNNSMTSTETAASNNDSRTVARAAASVTAACNKWLSESSGIFTASTQSQTASNSSVHTAEANCGSTTTTTTTSTSIVLSSVNSSLCSQPLDDLAENEGQDWRRGRTRSRKNSSKSKPQPRPVSTCAALAEKDRPAQPTEAIDMWSFGCLVAEVLTGTKMFSATDKMASVLKSHQLLEMKIGETEIKYDGLGQQEFFKDAKDLILRCLNEDPLQRLTAKEALEHQFFKNHDDLLPSTKDKVLLPSSILQLYNVLKQEKYKDPEELEGAIRGIRESAEKYGRVVGVSEHGGHAFIEFQEASDCQKAYSGLAAKTFVFAVFYPTSLWNKNIFV